MHLVGKRIVIRDFEAADAADYLAYARDPAVAKPAGMRVPADLAAATAAVRHFRDARSDFAIVRGGKVIGNIGAYPRSQDCAAPEAHTCELGYALAQPFWGQGLMSEAVELLCDFLFLAGTTEIWAAVFPDNLRSTRLLVALGFDYQFRVPLPQALSLDAPRFEDYYRLLPHA